MCSSDLILETRTTPAPVNDARCTHCSLMEACMPDSGLFKHLDPFRLTEDHLTEDNLTEDP